MADASVDREAEVSNMMNFVSKTRNCVLKTTAFVFNMMNFAGGDRSDQGDNVREEARRFQKLHEDRRQRHPGGGWRRVLSERRLLVRLPHAAARRQRYALTPRFDYRCVLVDFCSLIVGELWEQACSWR